MITKAQEVGTNVPHEKVNNLGQDSTVYKQYKDTKYDSEEGLAYTDLSEPVKTITKDILKQVILVKHYKGNALIGIGQKMENKD